MDARWASAGDAWVCGVNCGDERGYTITRPVLNTCLNINLSGEVNISYGLTSPVLTVDSIRASTLEYITIDDNAILNGTTTTTRHCSINHNLTVLGTSIVNTTTRIKTSGQGDGNFRVEPSVDGQESSVGYYNRNALRDIAAGDVWVGGINHWSMSGFTFGTPVLTSCLNLAINGNVTIPYNLNTPGINVDTISGKTLDHILLDDNVITTGYLNLTRAWGSGSGSISLVDTTAYFIVWRNVGTAAPSFTTRSIGTNLALYPHLSTSSTDYDVGVESNYLWHSSGSTATGHR